MSFIFTTPQALDNAAKSVSGIRSGAKDATSILRSTLFEPPFQPGVNRMISRQHMRQYHQISPAIEHRHWVRAWFRQRLAENAGRRNVH